MSQTRLRQDKCAYKAYTKQSTQPLSYNLYNGQVCNKNRCFYDSGPRNNRKNVTSSVTNIPKIDLIEVDSVLSARGSSDNNMCQKRLNELDNLGANSLPQNCKRPEIVDSRLDFSLGNYREMSVNRWDWEPINSQANIFWDSSINTRLAFKDNYEPDYPKPKNQCSVCPTEIKGSGKKCKVTCDN